MENSYTTTQVIVVDAPLLESKYTDIAFFTKCFKSKNHYMITFRIALSYNCFQVLSAYGYNA